MLTPRLTPLLDDGIFFESPRWHDGRWWVSDMYGHVVLAVDPQGHAREVMQVEAMPGGLGWLPDGSLLVVSMKDHRILRQSGYRDVTVHAEVPELCGVWLNDMVVDGLGRAYIGNFGFDFVAGEALVGANLIRVDPDGKASVAALGLLFPNGSVITPDGRTLIVGESQGGRYVAFDVAQDGSLSNRRVWAQPTPAPGAACPSFVPDGCAMDASGHIWSADPAGRRCVRLAPGGEIVEEIATIPDGTTVVACMLGGEDGRTLLLCLVSADANDNPEASAAVLITTAVDAPHGGWP